LEILSAKPGGVIKKGLGIYTKDRGDTGGGVGPTETGATGGFVKNLVY